MENRPQLIGDIEMSPTVGHRVFISPLPCRFLHKMQLLDIPRNRCLRTRNASLPEPLQKLLLRFNGFLCNNVKNQGLSVVLHAWNPPGSIF